MSRRFPAGVATGNMVSDIFQYAKESGFAIPAVNVIGSSNINATLETAVKLNSPVIIQFSNGGAAYNAGKGLSNEGQQASILGSIAGAHHIRTLAKAYGATVMVHTDHCAKKLLPWFDGFLAADEEYFKQHGESLFSSHMLDLSLEPLAENLKISAQYFERMAKIGQTLEVEIGITGGEEDGVDHSGVHSSKLYSQPVDVEQTYQALNAISDKFTIAAAFGNVHGVYKPGNVQLHPELLHDFQEHVQKVFKTGPKPVNFVFHGGSGSTDAEIKTAVGNGVVKMNIDTDLQFAYTEGIRDYMVEKIDYLKTQVGNPTGEDAPNKKFYDPRVWVRKGEETFTTRLIQAFENLNNVGTLS